MEKSLQHSPTTRRFEEVTSLKKLIVENYEAYSSLASELEPSELSMYSDVSGPLNIPPVAFLLILSVMAVVISDIDILRSTLLSVCFKNDP